MNEIEQIQERNKRVELDKAWETSFTRRFVIAVITYVFAVLWLKSTGSSEYFLLALWPVFGYLLSTWSLPFVKKWWVNKQTHD